MYSTTIHKHGRLYISLSAPSELRPVSGDGIDTLYSHCCSAKKYFLVFHGASSVIQLWAARVMFNFGDSPVACLLLTYSLIARRAEGIPGVVSVVLPGELPRGSAGTHAPATCGVP